MSDAYRRRVYTGANRSLRLTLGQDPFGNGTTIIFSPFATPEPSPGPNGQYANSGATGESRHESYHEGYAGSYHEGYAGDGARGPRAPRRERNPDAQAEEVFQRSVFTIFVRSS